MPSAASSGNLKSLHCSWTCCQIQYYPFGHYAELSSGSDVRMKFTGHERDESLGLDYMLARYYGAGLGAFLSPDRLNGTPMESGSWNKYTYVGQSPVRWIDPSGLRKMDPSVREFLETVFCRDMSRIRVHHNFISRFVLFLTPGKQGAVTLGRRIHFQKDAWAAFLAKTETGIAVGGHESVHAFQFRDIGFISFSAKYTWESIKHGTGSANRYETPAYDVEARIRSFLESNSDIVLAIQNGVPLTDEQKERITSAFPEYAQSSADSSSGGANGASDVQDGGNASRGRQRTRIPMFDERGGAWIHRLRMSAQLNAM